MRIRWPHWQLSGFYFFYYATLAGWVPYWGVYLHQQAFGAEFIGLSIATMLAMRIVGAVVWGYLGDCHLERLFLVRMGVILSCLGCVMLSFAQTRTEVLLVLLVVSFFWSAVLPQFETITLSQLGSAPEHYSWIRLWGSLGFVFSVVISGIVFGWVSVRVLPYFVLLLMSCCACISFIVPPPKETSSPKTVSPLWPLLRQPAVLSFLFSCVLVHLSHGPYYSFYSIYLRDYGYSHGAIGVLWALGVVAEMALFLWMPRVVGRYFASLLVLSILLASMRWGLIAMSEGRLWILLFAQLLHAASFGSFHAAGIEWIRRVFKGRVAGRGQALYNAVGFGVGGALGALGTGLLWPVYGAMFAYATASVIALTALVFCVPAMRLVRHNNRGQTAAKA